MNDKKVIYIPKDENEKFTCSSCAHKVVCDILKRTNICHYYIDERTVIMRKEVNRLKKLGFEFSDGELLYFKEAIKRISDPVIREVAYQYYITGIKLDEIAEYLNYSIRQTERFHQKSKNYIIKCLLEILEEKQ